MESNTIRELSATILFNQAMHLFMLADAFLCISWSNFNQVHVGADYISAHIHTHVVVLDQSLKNQPLIINIHTRKGTYTKIKYTLRNNYRKLGNFRLDKIFAACIDGEKLNTLKFFNSERLVYTCTCMCICTYVITVLK